MDEKIANRMNFFKCTDAPELSACSLCGDSVKIRTTNLGAMRSHVFRVHDEEEDLQMASTSSPEHGTNLEMPKKPGHWWMSYFVENDNDAICKLCKTFSLKKTRFMALKKHLEHSHTTQFKDHEKFLKFTYADTNREEINEFGNSTPDEEMVDDIICKFFAKHGLPSDTIRDPTFMQLLYCLDKGYMLPTPKTIENVKEVIAVKTRKFNTDSLEAAAATVDIVQNNNVQFLAFSIHEFDRGVRTDRVHLRKLNAVTPLRAEIIDEMQKAVDEVQSNIIRFTNLVASNKKIEELLFTNNIVKNSYICFYTHICEFVDDLLTIPDFADGLKTLLEFVANIRNSYYNKFEKFLSSRAIIYELPDLPNNDWREINYFLMRVFQNHTNFETFDQVECSEAYISNKGYSELMKLHWVLTVVEDCVKILSKPGVPLSVVLPEILKLRCFIRGEAGKSSNADAINKKFGEHFNKFLKIDGFRANNYAIATFLDPRFANAGELRPMGFWSDVEKVLVEEMVSNDVPYEYQEGPLRFQMTIEKELKTFNSHMSTHRPAQSTNPFHWWEKNQPLFPNLCKKARSALAPPPMAIDGAYFFGEKGKFGNLPKSTTHFAYTNQLRVASSLQKYRGRGAVVEELKLEMFAAPKYQKPVKTVLPPRKPAKKVLNKLASFFEPSTSMEYDPQNDYEELIVNDAQFEALLNPNKAPETVRRINEDEISQMLMEPPENIDEKQYQLQEVKKEVAYEVQREEQLLVPKNETDEDIVAKAEITDESESVTVGKIRKRTEFYSQPESSAPKRKCLLIPPTEQRQIPAENSQSSSYNEALNKIITSARNESSQGTSNPAQPRIIKRIHLNNLGRGKKSVMMSKMFLENGGRN